MITLPDNIVKEAKSLQDCIERGQFNTQLLLSFLKTVAGAKQVKTKQLSPTQKEMYDHFATGIAQGRIRKFKKKIS